VAELDRPEKTRCWELVGRIEDATCPDTGRMAGWILGWTAGFTSSPAAGDADRWAGTILSARQLADTYDVTDTDGSKPDCWGYLAAYGWEREDGEGIDRFR
jgi:hypothetical protein